MSILVCVNIIVAAILIINGPNNIIYYGLSWFASLMIGNVVFSMSISRYMTPAVTATFSKIGEFLSSSRDGKDVA